MMTKEPTTIEVPAAAPTAPSPTPAINAEQEATARKEGRTGFHFPIYAVTAKRIEHVRLHPAPPLTREGASKIEVTVPANGVVIGAPIIGIPAEPEAITFIEAERYIDARGFACRILGCSEVDITRLDVTNGHRPFPRWQIRHTGYSPALVFQARLLQHAFEFTSDDHGWKDVRNL